MFDQIFGLPAHPLIIHAAVAVTPLLAVLAIAYVVVPRWRHKFDWALVVSAVAAPLSLMAAEESGDALKDRLFHGQAASAAVETHESFADPLITLTWILAVAVLVHVFLTRAGRGPAGATSGAVRLVTLVLSVANVILALLVMYYVIRTGHSGATAVWKN